MKFALALVTLLSFTASQTLASSSWWPGGVWKGRFYAPGYYHNYSYYKEKVVVPVYAPVAVFAPVALYGAVYNSSTIAPGATANLPTTPAPAATVPAPPAPPSSPPAPAAGPSELQQVLSALKGMDERLRKLESGGINDNSGGGPRPVDPFNPAATPPAGAPAAVTAPPKATALSIFQAKCASCHGKETAGDQGGGLILLADGSIPRLSDGEVKKIWSRTYQQSMPPKKSGIPPLTDEEMAIVMDHFR